MVVRLNHDDEAAQSFWADRGTRLGKNCPLTASIILIVILKWFVAILLSLVSPCSDVWVLYGSDRIWVRWLRAVAPCCNDGEECRMYEIWIFRYLKILICVVDMGCFRVSYLCYRKLEIFMNFRWILKIRSNSFHKIYLLEWNML